MLPGPEGCPKIPDADEFVETVRLALYAAKICSYAQGFAQLRAAAESSGWDLNHSAIAMLWRGGCIIRAALLEHIKTAFDRKPGLQNLLLDPYFTDTVDRCQAAWRRTVAVAVAVGIPVPALSAGLAYYDGYRSQRLPHNLLQAQRDYFGAHTYERIDREGHFHTDWKKGRLEPSPF